MSRNKSSNWLPYLRNLKELMPYNFYSIRADVSKWNSAFDGVYFYEWMKYRISKLHAIKTNMHIIADQASQVGSFIRNYFVCAGWSCLSNLVLALKMTGP